MPEQQPIAAVLLVPHSREVIEHSGAPGWSVSERSRLVELLSTGILRQTRTGSVDSWSGVSVHTDASRRDGR